MAAPLTSIRLDKELADKAAGNLVNRAQLTGDSEQLYS